MALTLESEQRLENVGLSDLFAEHEAAWQQAAKETKEFIAEVKD